MRQIVLVDAFGNAGAGAGARAPSAEITEEAVGAPGAAQPVVVTSDGAGGFDLEAPGTRAGAYALEVRLADKEELIAGGPIPFTLEPLSFVEGGDFGAAGVGLTLATAGAPASFVLQTRDRFGNRAVAPAASPFALGLSDARGRPLAFWADVALTRAGEWAVSAIFTSAAADGLGRAALRVSALGAPIPGAPFALAVAPGALSPGNPPPPPPLRY